MIQTPENEPVVLLVGPTASGKTALAVELARRAGAEIVSADSRQVYRYLDVGTAKPAAEERGGIPHHGFDVADPDERYSAGRYAEEARGWIEEIRARGKRVVVTGGSGLYLQALVDGFFAGEDIKDEEVRAALERRADTVGIEALYDDLVREDPEYAARTRPGDRQRILRALEVIEASGVPFSRLHAMERNEAPFETCWFGLDWPREELYARIDRRVDEMFDRGLVAEVRSLLDRGWRGENALKSVGYDEIIAVFEGRLPDLATARSEIRKNTRRYAKRQLTWFRHEPRIVWLPVSNRTPQDLVETILKQSGWTA